MKKSKAKINIKDKNGNSAISVAIRRGNKELVKLLISNGADVNIKYVKMFLKVFTQHSAGQICIVSPVSGLASPSKPDLHPQVYRIIESVQRRVGEPLPFYVISAYPHINTTYHYIAPLLSRHTFIAQGYFYLPDRDYEGAHAIVADRLRQLRQAAHFTAPDYERLSRK